MLIERLLIVGYGSIGQRHLRIARGLLPSADIRVLRHRKCDFVPEYANGCMSNLADVWSFAPQAAVIASPSTFHMQIAHPLAEAGIHLLIEKPLADSIQSVPQTLGSCAAHGTVLITAYNLRFLPSLQFYRQSVHSGFIGKLLSVHCECGQYLPSWRPGIDYRRGVSASRVLGGGVLLELSHEFDYLSWIFGRIEWVNAWLGKQSSLEIDVEDTAHLVLGFQSSQQAQLVATLNLDSVRHDTTRRCVAIGEKGSLQWDAARGTVKLWLEGESDWSVLYQNAPDRDFSYTAQWESFLRSVAGEEISGNVSGASLQEALAVLHVVEAARTSALKKGLQVKVASGYAHAH